jgi:Xaa-Pro aminopeptidase
MDDAFAESLASARVGDTEASLHRSMLRHLTDLGFRPDQSGWTLVGQRAAEVHRVPSDEKQLEPGDIVRTDYVAAFKNYMANLSRMAIVGSPSLEQRSAYQELLAVEQATCQHVGPGVKACEVFDCCHKAILERGFDHPLRLVGHGIGLDVHEYPMIVASETAKLQANMVVCLEPVIGPYYHIQNQFLLTQDGLRCLSDRFSTDHLYVIH